MKHTECKDCKLRDGDCGYHFKMDGITDYDIPRQSSCDQYDNCMFFQQKPDMSNEEVIDVLKGMVFNNFDRTTPKEREALDLAIKALEKPQVTVFAENASKEEIEDFKQELENVLEKTQGDWMPLPEPYKRGEEE